MRPAPRRARRLIARLGESGMGTFLVRNFFGASTIMTSVMSSKPALLPATCSVRCAIPDEGSLLEIAAEVCSGDIALRVHSHDAGRPGVRSGDVE